MSIRWRGPLLDASDHATGSRVMLRGIDAQGAEPTLEQTPWGMPPVVSAAEVGWLALRDARGEAARATVQRTLARLLTPHTRGLRVAWTAFAGIEPDRETLMRLRQLDGVWTPSEAQRDALVAAGIDEERVAVLPEPVDLAIVRPAAAASPAPGAHGTVFLAVTGPVLADGCDLLVGAWAQAFAADDDVTLVIAPAVGERPAGAEPTAERLAADLAAGGFDPSAIADLVIIDEPLSERRMAGLLAACDVVVLPARAGGLGRRAADALAAGRPVVGTVGQGVDDAVGWTVPCERQAVSAEAAAERRELTGCSWWGYRPEDLAAAMAAAHADAEGRRVRGATARERAARHDHARIAGAALTHLAGLTPAPPRRSLRLGVTRVVLEGPVLGPSSLAGVNRDLARALATGWDLELSVVETEAAAAEPLPSDVDPLVQAMARTRAGAPQVVVRNAHPPSFVPPAVGAYVQFLYWEFGGLPQEWRAGAERADEIWVPSAIVRDALVADGMDPDRIAEIPLGVDASRFHPGVEPMDLGDSAPGMRLLFIGGLVWRKGADLLLDAYSRAFTRDDAVTLVIKDFGAAGPYPVGDIAIRAERMAADPSGPRVLRLSGSLPGDALPGLYTACDALVHPYRAEAFGLTMLEAMACGLTVIAPDHGPAGGFLLPDAAVPLPAHLVRAPTNRFGPWTMPEPPLVGEVHVEDLAAAMRAAYDDPAAVAARAARAVEVAGAHTWFRAAGVAADRLRMLATLAPAWRAAA